MDKLNGKKILDEGRRVLNVEAGALKAAEAQLDKSFAEAVLETHNALQKGAKVILSGVGKSGNIAQKIAATLTSTGSVSVFLHPTDALHGDLGVARADDILIVISNSGSSAELGHLLDAANPLVHKSIGLFGKQNGTLADKVDYLVACGVSAEACPNNLAPTASSTVQMAVGDAFAMALQKLAGFNPEHYAKFHPGGSLGKRLQLRVENLMSSGDKLPLLTADSSMEQVLLSLTEFRLGGVCIVDKVASSNKLLGVIVEGDIRRALSNKAKFFDLTADDIMTKNPTVVSPETMATDALEVMENRERAIGFLPVTSSEGNCLGVIRIHDLVQAGLN